MIFYDNIINYINAGNGISRLFNDIQDGLIKNNINFKILDDAKEKNYYFKRYLSFDMKDLTRKDIFHSTYYRLSKKSINVTTVHDFTYEKKNWRT